MRVASPAADSLDGTNTAEAVPCAFALHITAGGEPHDTALAKRVADELDAAAATVRRVLGEARRQLSIAGDPR